MLRALNLTTVVVVKTGRLWNTRWPGSPAANDAVRTGGQREGKSLLERPFLRSSLARFLMYEMPSRASNPWHMTYEDPVRGGTVQETQV